MSKRKVIILLTVLITFTFSGCWSRREINELAIVAAMGLDKTPDGKIELTVEIVRPAVLTKGVGSAAKGKSYWIVEATGETVLDTARNLNLKSPRRLFFSHTQVLVFGERLARDGLLQVLERISRSNEVRRNIYVLITPGRAKDIIEAEPDIENVPGIGLRGLIERLTVTSKGVGVDLKDFLAALSSKSSAPVATKIEIIPDNRTREIWPGQARGAGTAEGQAGPGTVKSVELTGTAVFHEDKLVGWLNQEESTGLLWVKGNVQRTITVIREPQEGKIMGIETTRSASELKPELKGGKVKMTVKIRQEGDIAEFTGRAKVDTPEKVHRIDDILAKKIKEQAERTIKKAQGPLHADIFGFGEAIRRKYPQKWAEIEPNWQQLFRELEVEVKVQANIRRRNLTTQPPERSPF